MPDPAYTLTPVALADEPGLARLYDLYCRNFPLPEEQETQENFQLCLALNDAKAVQAKHGPYHESYLAIRPAGQDGAEAILGGLIFGVASSAAHRAHGFLATVQAIYLFLEKDRAVSRWLLSAAGRAQIEAAILDQARAACLLPHFRAAAGEATSGRIAILFEVNDPLRMSQRQKDDDRDLSHVHPALRYCMWMANGAAPMEADYVQPPLSAGQAPAHYLDLFALHRLPGEPPAAEWQIPGPVLAAHLERFFRISVLKADELAIRRARVAETMARLAQRPAIRLLPEDAPKLARIAAEATAATPKVIEAAHEERLATESALRTRRASLWAVRWLPYARRYLGYVVGGVAGLLALEGELNLTGRLAELRSMHGWLREAAIGVTGLLLGAQWLRNWLAKVPDPATDALRDALRQIAGWWGWFSAEHRLTTLRELLRDRAATQFAYGLLAPKSAEQREALAGFLGAETTRRVLDENDRTVFERYQRLETRRLAQALATFPLAVLRGRSALAEEARFLSVVLPVLPECLEEGGDAYARLEDFHRWLDPRAAEALAKADEDGADLSGIGHLCLFVHTVFEWQPDPRYGDLLEGFATPASFRPRGAGRGGAAAAPGQGIARRMAAHATRRAESRVAAPLGTEAETGLGRVLAVLSHLALLLGHAARDRKVTTDLRCPCTVLVHVVSPSAIAFFRGLGFAEVPREAGNAPAGTALEGMLMRLDLAPGANAFVALREANPAAGTCFGLISELAEAQRLRRG
jgi:hypothetical protein